MVNHAPQFSHICSLGGLKFESYFKTTKHNSFFSHVLLFWITRRRKNNQRHKQHVKFKVNMGGGGGYMHDWGYPK